MNTLPLLEDLLLPELKLIIIDYIGENKYQLNYKKVIEEYKNAFIADVPFYRSECIVSRMDKNGYFFRYNYRPYYFPLYNVIHNNKVINKINHFKIVVKIVADLPKNY